MATSSINPEKEEYKGWKAMATIKKKKKQLGWGLPLGLSGKESTCQCRRHRFDA